MKFMVGGVIYFRPTPFFLSRPTAHTAGRAVMTAPVCQIVYSNIRGSFKPSLTAYDFVKHNRINA